jgi:hypothetical protein
VKDGEGVGSSDRERGSEGEIDRRRGRQKEWERAVVI